jgi:hypothetical protein
MLFLPMCVSSLINIVSEAGNIKYYYELHARSGVRFIIQLQEDAWIVPTRALGWVADPRISWHPSEG